MQIAKYNFQQSLNIKDNNITKEYVVLNYNNFTILLLFLYLSSNKLVSME